MKKVLFLLLLLPMVTPAFPDRPAAQSLGWGRQDASRLMEAFRETGAKFEDYTVTGWIQLDPTKPDEPGQKSAAWKAAEALGIQREELAETFREDNGFTGLRLAGKLNPDTYVEILVKGMDRQSYMLITLYSKGDPEKLVFYRNRVKEAFDTSGRGAKIATIIKGSFPGKLTREAREKLNNQMFTFLGAQKSEGISTEELVSWSGYSPQLPDRLETRNKVINLNVASRYSSTTDSTALIVGTPIISGEY